MFKLWETAMTNGSIRSMTYLLVISNSLMLLFFLRSPRIVNDEQVIKLSKRDVDDEQDFGFTAIDSEEKLIHIVKETDLYNWQENEFTYDFATCQHYTNCKIKVHEINMQTQPVQIPNYGHAVVFTAEALSKRPRAGYWSQVATHRPPGLLWVLHSMSNPFEFPLDFLSFRNYQFNLTMTYKTESDIFTPFGFWQSQGEDDVNPKFMPKKNFAANKTRKVLWAIDGPCESVNNRMKYATDLSKFIPVDIIGRCWDATKQRDIQIDQSTHNNQNRRGVISDYKFYLAFEDISCRDYVTNVYFDAVKRQDVIPIVMGARKSTYELLGPPGAFIHIDDFDGPEDLANYLNEIDAKDNLYNQYFRYTATGGEFGVPASSMCRLCDAINFLLDSDDNKKSYNREEFDQFWTLSDCNLNHIFHANEL